MLSHASSRPDKKRCGRKKLWWIVTILCGADKVMAWFAILYSINLISNYRAGYQIYIWTINMKKDFINLPQKNFYNKLSPPPTPQQKNISSEQKWSFVKFIYPVLLSYFERVGL